MSRELLRASARARRRQRIEKAPAMRLADQDHPFLRVGEIGEIRIVARIGDVEIDLDVDQQVARVRATRPRPRCRAARGPCCARRRRRAGRTLRTLAAAVRRLEARDHAVVDCRKRVRRCRSCSAPGRPCVDRLVQDRLEVVLRHVDDEGIAGVLGRAAPSAPTAVAVLVARSMSPISSTRSALGEDLVGDAVAAERPRACASGWCRPWCRCESSRVLLEQQERQAVEVEPERGGEADRPGADHEDGLDRGRSSLGVLRRDRRSRG